MLIFKTLAMGERYENVCNIKGQPAEGRPKLMIEYAANNVGNRFEHVVEIVKL